MHWNIQKDILLFSVIKDSRTYGHKQLSRMIANLKERFELKTQEGDGSNAFYVRMKE